MKRNIIIITLIFIVPIVAYAIMAKNQTASAAKYTSGQPEILKFSSKLCADCKKIKAHLDVLKPKYQDRINFIEFDIENNDKNISDAIDKYNISLVPTLIFVDQNGKEIRRLEGSTDKNTLEIYINELLK